MRRVIVHYHIFKNAGSTVDSILKRDLGDAWAAYEGPTARSKISADDLAAFIKENPHLSAVSSHHARLPAPEIEGIDIIPVIFLRDPIDRVLSVYNFERKQGQLLGPISMGAEKAAILDFPDYVRWRLSASLNGVISNCHLVWLLGHPKWQRLGFAEWAYAEAYDALSRLPVVGIVESFDDSLEIMRRVLAAKGIDVDTSYSAVNQNQDRPATLEERRARVQELLGPDLYEELLERNAWDLRLYQDGARLLAQRLDGEPLAASA